MRKLALLAVAALLVAGCAQPSPPAAGDEGAEPADDAPQRSGRSGRGSEGEDDNRTVAVIGYVSGGPTDPGTYPLPLVVPAGGATEVEWTLEVVPVAAFTLDKVQGPGCEAYGWHVGAASSGTSGICSQVPEGTPEWSFVLNAPVASYEVEVRGHVWDPAQPEPDQSSSNATER